MGFDRLRSAEPQAYDQLSRNKSQDRADNVLKSKEYFIDSSAVTLRAHKTFKHIYDKMNVTMNVMTIIIK